MPQSAASASGRTIGPFYAVGNFGPSSKDLLPLALGDEIFFLPLEEQVGAPPGFFKGAIEGVGVGFVPWMFTTPVKIMEPLSDPDDQFELLNGMVQQMLEMVKAGFAAVGVSDSESNRTFVSLDTLLDFIDEQQVEWHAANDGRLLGLHIDFEEDARKRASIHPDRLIVPTHAFAQARFPTPEQFRDYAVYVRPGPEILADNLQQVVDASGRIEMDMDSPGNSAWAEQLLEYFSQFSYEDIFGVADDDGDQDQEAAAGPLLRAETIEAQTLQAAAPSRSSSHGADSVRSSDEAADSPSDVDNSGSVSQAPPTDSHLANAVVHTGELKKLPQVAFPVSRADAQKLKASKFVKRYFKLTNSTLSYYKNAKKLAADDPAGRIAISANTALLSWEDVPDTLHGKLDRGRCILLQSSEVFLVLRTRTNSDLRNWCTHLSSAISWATKNSVHVASATSKVLREDGATLALEAERLRGSRPNSVDVNTFRGEWSEHIGFCGVLIKVNELGKKQRRFCRIEQTSPASSPELVYYRVPAIVDEAKFDPNRQAERGRVVLTAACFVEQHDDESDLGFMFRLHCPGNPKSPYTFVVKHRAVFDEWITRLEGCIGEAQVLLSPAIRARVNNNAPLEPGHADDTAYTGEVDDDATIDVQREIESGNFVMGCVKVNRAGRRQERLCKIFGGPTTPSGDYILTYYNAQGREKGSFALTAVCYPSVGKPDFQPTSETPEDLSFQIHCPGNPRSPYTFEALDSDDLVKWDTALRFCINAARKRLRSDPHYRMPTSETDEGQDPDAQAGELEEVNPLLQFDGSAIAQELDNKFRTLGTQVHDTTILSAVAVVKSLVEKPTAGRSPSHFSSASALDGQLSVRASTRQSVLCVLCRRRLFWCALDGEAASTNRIASQAAAYADGEDGGYESGASDDDPGVGEMLPHGFLSVQQRTLVEQIQSTSDDDDGLLVGRSQSSRKLVYTGHGGRGIVVTSPHLAGTAYHRVALVFANDTSGIFDSNPTVAERLNQRADAWLRTLRAMIRRLQADKNTIYGVLRAAEMSGKLLLESYPKRSGDAGDNDGQASGGSANPYVQPRDGFHNTDNAAGAVRHAHSEGDILVVGVEFVDFSGFVQRKFRRNIGLRISVQNLIPSVPDAYQSRHSSEAATKAHFARLIHETLSSDSLDDDTLRDGDGAVSVVSTVYSRQLRCNWRDMTHSDFVFPASAAKSARHVGADREMHLVFEFFTDKCEGQAAQSARGASGDVFPRTPTALARLAVPLSSIAKEPNFHRFRVPSIAGTGTDGQSGVIVCSTTVLSSMTLRLKSMIASAARKAPQSSEHGASETVDSQPFTNLCSYAHNTNPRRRLFCLVEQFTSHLRFTGAAVSSFDVDDYPLGPELFRARFSVACGSANDPPGTYTDEEVRSNIFTSAILSGRFQGHEISGTGDSYSVIFSFSWAVQAILEMYWQNVADSGDGKAVNGVADDPEHRDPEVLWVRIAGAFAPNSPLACDLSTAWTPLQLVNDVSSLACRTAGSAHLNDVGSSTPLTTPDVSLDVSYSVVDPTQIMTPYRRHLDSQDLATGFMFEDSVYGNVSLEQLVSLERMLLVNIVEARDLSLRCGSAVDVSVGADSRYRPDFTDHEWDVAQTVGTIMRVEAGMQFRFDAGVIVDEDGLDPSSEPQTPRFASSSNSQYEHLAVFPEVTAVDQSAAVKSNAPTELEQLGSGFSALVRERGCVNFLDSAVNPPSFSFVANLFDGRTDVQDDVDDVDKATADTQHGTTPPHRFTAIPATAGILPNNARASKPLTRLQKLLSLQDSVDALDVKFSLRTISVVPAHEEEMKGSTVFSSHFGDDEGDLPVLQPDVARAALMSATKGRRIRVLAGSANLFDIDYELNKPVDCWIPIEQSQQSGSTSAPDDTSRQAGDARALDGPRLRVAFTYFVPALMPPARLLVPQAIRENFRTRRGQSTVGTLLMFYVDRLTALPQTKNAHGGSTRLVIVARQASSRSEPSSELVPFGQLGNTRRVAPAHVVLSRELTKAPASSAGGGGYQWEQSAANTLVLPTTTTRGSAALVSVEVFALHRPDPKYDAECLLGSFLFHSNESSLSGPGESIEKHVLSLTPSTETRFRAAVHDVDEAIRRAAATPISGAGSSSSLSSNTPPPRLQAIQVPAKLVALEEFFNPSELASTCLEARSCGVDLELLGFHLARDCFSSSRSCELKKSKALETAVRRLQLAWHHRRAREWSDEVCADGHGDLSPEKLIAIAKPFAATAMQRAEAGALQRKMQRDFQLQLAVRRVQNAFTSFRATVVGRQALGAQDTLALVMGSSRQRRPKLLGRGAGSESDADSSDSDSAAGETGPADEDPSQSSNKLQQERKSTLLGRLSRAVRLFRLKAGGFGRGKLKQHVQKRDSFVARVQLAWLTRGVRHHISRTDSYAQNGSGQWSTVRQGVAPAKDWHRLTQFFAARNRKLITDRDAEDRERQAALGLMVRRVQSAWLVHRAQQSKDDDDDTSMLDLVWARIRKSKQKKGDYLRQMALVLQMAYRRREALVEYNNRLNDAPAASKAVPEALMRASVQRVTLAWIRFNRRQGSPAALLKHLRRALLQQKVQSTSGVGAIMAQRLQEMYIQRKSSLTYRSCYVVTVFAARGIPLHCRRGNFVRLKLVDRHGRVVGTAQQTTAVHDLENPMWINSATDSPEEPVAAAIPSQAAQGGASDPSLVADVEIRGLHFVFPHLPAFHRGGAHRDGGYESNEEDSDSRHSDDSYDNQDEPRLPGGRRRRRSDESSQPMFVFELFRETDDGADLIGSATYPTRAVGFGKHGGGQWIPVNAKDAAIRVALSWVDMSRYASSVFANEAEKAATAWREMEAKRIREERARESGRRQEQAAPSQWKAIVPTARVRSRVGGRVTRMLSPGEAIKQHKTEFVGGRLWIGFHDTEDISWKQAQDPDSRLAQALGRLGVDQSTTQAVIPAPLRWVAVTSRRPPYTAKLSPLDDAGLPMPKYARKLKDSALKRAKRNREKHAPGPTHLLITIPNASNLPEYRHGSVTPHIVVDFVAQRDQASLNSRRADAIGLTNGRQEAALTDSSSGSDSDDGGEDGSEDDNGSEATSRENMSFVRKAVRLESVGPTSNPCWMESRARCSFLLDVRDVNLRGLSKPRLFVSVRDSTAPENHQSAEPTNHAAGHRNDNEEEPTAAHSHHKKQFVEKVDASKCLIRRKGLGNVVGVVTIPLSMPSADPASAASASELDVDAHSSESVHRGNGGGTEGEFNFERVYPLSTVGIVNSNRVDSATQPTITVGLLYFNLHDVAAAYEHSMKLEQLMTEQRLVRKTLLSKINDRVLQVLDIVADNSQYILATRDTGDTGFVALRDRNTDSTGSSVDSMTVVRHRSRRRRSRLYSNDVIRQRRWVPSAGQTKRVHALAGQNLGERTARLAQHRQHLLESVVVPLTSGSTSHGAVAADTTSSNVIGADIGSVSDSHHSLLNLRGRGESAVAVLERRLSKTLSIMPGLFNNHEIREMRATVVMLALLGNNNFVNESKVSSHTSPGQAVIGNQGPMLRKFFDAVTTLTFLRTHAYNTGVSRRVEFSKLFYMAQQAEQLSTLLRQVARKCQLTELLRLHSAGRDPAQFSAGRADGVIADGPALLLLSEKLASLRAGNVQAIAPIPNDADAIVSASKSGQSMEFIKSTCDAIGLIGIKTNPIQFKGDSHSSSEPPSGERIVSGRIVGLAVPISQLQAAAKSTNGYLSGAASSLAKDAATGLRAVNCFVRITVGARSWRSSDLELCLGCFAPKSRLSDLDEFDAGPTAWLCGEQSRIRRSLEASKAASRARRNALAESRRSGVPLREEADVPSYKLDTSDLLVLSTDCSSDRTAFAIDPRNVGDAAKRAVPRGDGTGALSIDFAIEIARLDEVGDEAWAEVGVWATPRDYKSGHSENVCVGTTWINTSRHQSAATQDGDAPPLLSSPLNNSPRLSYVLHSGFTRPDDVNRLAQRGAALHHAGHLLRTNIGKLPRTTVMSSTFPEEPDNVHFHEQHPNRVVQEQATRHDTRSPTRTATRSDTVVHTERDQRNARDTSGVTPPNPPDKAVRLQVLKGGAKRGAKKNAKQGVSRFLCDGLFKKTHKPALRQQSRDAHSRDEQAAPAPAPQPVVSTHKVAELAFERYCLLEREQLVALCSRRQISTEGSATTLAARLAENDARQRPPAPALKIASQNSTESDDNSAARPQPTPARSQAETQDSDRMYTDTVQQSHSGATHSEGDPTAPVFSHEEASSTPPPPYTESEDDFDQLNPMAISNFVTSQVIRGRN